MAKTFYLTIAKVGENLFEGEAISATLPGLSGQFTILAHHEAYVSELKAGTAMVKSPDGTVRSIEVPSGGIAEVSHNQATVLL
jgi:F0F1-type ATP synthase epsilon subunit